MEDQSVPFYHEHDHVIIGHGAAVCNYDLIRNVFKNIWVM